MGASALPPQPAVPGFPHLQMLITIISTPPRGQRALELAWDLLLQPPLRAPSQGEGNQGGLRGGRGGRPQSHTAGLTGNLRCQSLSCPPGVCTRSPPGQALPPAPTQPQDCQRLGVSFPSRVPPSGDTERTGPGPQGLHAGAGGGILRPEQPGTLPGGGGTARPLRCRNAFLSKTKVERWSAAGPADRPGPSTRPRTSSQHSGWAGWACGFLRHRRALGLAQGRGGRTEPRSSHT